jgi:hypothetical protein
MKSRPDALAKEWTISRKSIGSGRERFGGNENKNPLTGGNGGEAFLEKVARAVRMEETAGGRYGGEDGAVRAVIGAWAKTRPEDAARRVDSIGSVNRPSVIKELIQGWSSRNAESAAQWLLARPVGQERDGAVVVLSNRMAREDPVAGLSLAEGIADPQSRSETMSQIGREWMRVDPTAARQWISQSKLPDAVRAEVLK